jgi:hypothetical protein
MDSLFDFYLNKIFVFPEYNKVHYCQDFRCYSGHIPHDIEFRLEKFIDYAPDYCVVLRGKGHGMKQDYGCGAITAKLIEILPYMKM